MPRMNQSLPWEVDPNQNFVPISYEGTVIGFCQASYAKRIIDILNDENKLRKALNLACYDLITQSGGNSATIKDLIQKYLTRAERPKSGTGAIALLLKERQDELDLTDEEFIKFCDTFRLIRENLQGIYAGADIDSAWLAPLSRILGISMDELIDVLQGKN